MTEELKKSTPFTCSVCCQPECAPGCAGLAIVAAALPVADGHAELRAALVAIQPYLDGLYDCGPSGEEWRSDALDKAICAVSAALAQAAPASPKPDVHSRLMEMSAIIRAGVKWTGNEYAFADLSESDVAMLDDLLGDALSKLHAPASPASAPEAPHGEAILKARAEGRAEAVAMILSMEPEDALNDCTASYESACGEWDTNWDEPKLRAKFRADDKLFDMQARAEAAFYDYQEARMVIQYEAEQRRLAATLPPVVARKVLEPATDAVAKYANALALAKDFHERYERLAPSLDYSTRTETREFDPESSNGRLMVAVCSEILRDAARLPGTNGSGVE